MCVYFSRYVVIVARINAKYPEREFVERYRHTKLLRPTTMSIVHSVPWLRRSAICEANKSGFMSSLTSNAGDVSLGYEHYSVASECTTSDCVHTTALHCFFYETKLHCFFFVFSFIHIHPPMGINSNGIFRNAVTMLYVFFLKINEIL